jgi:DNA-binding NtrC family response regulator
VNILLVDDKPSLVRVTSMALRLVGCQAFTADTTATAIHVLNTEKIDAVFLDVNLGGENGLDFLARLTAESGRPPVIIFTCHTRDEIAGEAMSRGAFDCLIKPCTLDDLRQLVVKIEHHRLAGNGVPDQPSRSEPLP